MHTGYKILVGQANCSQAIRCHALYDVAHKQISVGVSKPLYFTTSAQYPAASNDKQVK